MCIVPTDQVTPVKAITCDPVVDQIYATHCIPSYAELGPGSRSHLGENPESGVLAKRMTVTPCKSMAASLASSRKMTMSLWSNVPLNNVYKPP